MTSDIDDIASRTEIVPYPDVSGELPEFDCGKNFFNTFINSQEIEEYHREQLGITRIVYFDGELAAFYSLSANALRDDDYEGVETENANDWIESKFDIPAYLLGHLAVDKEYQGQGLGKFLLFRAIAQSKTANVPFRVLLLHAQEGVVDFYKEYGFAVSESEDDYPQLMFIDLAEISNT